jgi:hypothetical protein
VCPDASRSTTTPSLSRARRSVFSEIPAASAAAFTSSFGRGPLANSSRRNCSASPTFVPAVVGLYEKRDGRPVEINQVHARTKNYPHMFEKQRSRIRLVTDTPKESSK